MSDAETFFSEGLQAHRHGLLADAGRLYRQALTLNPQHPQALHLLGVIVATAGDPAEGVQLIRRSLALAPDNPLALYNLGNVLMQQGHSEEALAHYDAALQLKPAYPQALVAQGKALAQSQRLYAALQSLQAALQLQPELADARLQMAHTLGLLRRHDAALALLERMPDTQALTLRNTLGASKRLHEQRLAHLVGPTHRHNPARLYEKALQVHRQGSYDEAVELLDAAINLEPRNAEYFFYKGHCHVHRRQLQAAIECCDLAVALNPAHSNAYLNGGSALVELQQYPQALVQFDKAIAADAGNSSALFMKLYTQMNLCDWAERDALCAHALDLIRSGQCPMQPLPVLALTSDIDVHRLAGQHHFQELHGDIRPSLSQRNTGPVHRPIRVGYFSPDLRNHAVSSLTAELFELHDRAQFEVHAFYYGPPCDDAMHQRLRRAFDHFHDVRDLGDLALAQKSRALGIDIAVDLAGHTLDSRMGVFAHRAAPVQINYLGYPGTSGHPQMDYILADPVLIPRALARHYSEQVVYLPCYQVNDRQREVSERVFTRSELGLPETGVVYCCFNATYKIGPQVFAAWMQILAQVPGSTLLLLQTHALAVSHLRAAARAAGMDPQRLVFVPRVAARDYLARYRSTDLFLDTWPFNAGTTASDALWAGLPVLTCMGQAYASRMAGSLLQRAGLPELVTDSPSLYVQQAVALGRSPARLTRLRARLNSAEVRERLFDTPGWVRELERALRLMHERACQGQPPALMDLEDHSR